MFRQAENQSLRLDLLLISEEAHTGPAKLFRQPAEKKFVLPPDFIGATLDYTFDFPRIEGEVRACEEHFVYSPPYPSSVAHGLSGAIPFLSESADNYRCIDTYSHSSGIQRNALRATSSLYLRNSRERDALRDPAYALTKALDHRSWFWRTELAARIPYTIECIESLPYLHLGMVRAFISDSTFMPTHRDMAPAPVHDSRKHAIGISLVPATGGVGVLVWSERERRAMDLRGHCLLFDDSCWHGVPMTRGMRITLRIFGELDFARLEPHLGECHCA